MHCRTCLDTRADIHLFGYVTNKIRCSGRPLSCGEPHRFNRGGTAHQSSWQLDDVHGPRIGCRRFEAPEDTTELDGGLTPAPVSVDAAPAIVAVGVSDTFEFRSLLQPFSSDMTVYGGIKLLAALIFQKGHRYTLGFAALPRLAHLGSLREVWRRRWNNCIGNLDGYILTEEWDFGVLRQRIKSRVAADFRNWENSSSDFDKQVDRVTKALRSDEGVREKQPPPSRL
jgi:hypothetical protein